MQRETKRSILFNGEMVRAILQGRKTQTRRLVKHQPRMADGSKTNWTRFERVGPFFHIMADEPLKAMFTVKCPYGQAGDRLWVKETFMPSATKECAGEVQILYKASNDERPSGTSIEDYGAAKWFVLGDAEVNEYKHQIEHMEVYGDKWTPSIFMPRKFSRITLEIVSVRAERLQEISEADAVAEGCAHRHGVPDIEMFHTGSPREFTFVEAYKDSWQSINGPGSWAKNPWVWVIEFRKV